MQNRGITLRNTGVKAFKHQGVARIFQRGGHRGYSPDSHVDLHAVHVLLNVTVLG